MNWIRRRRGTPSTTGPSEQRTTDRTSTTTGAAYFHIGQAKTGSSYIQSCLRLSVNALRDVGIDYVLQSPEHYEVDSGRITSGYGRGLFSSPTPLAEALAEGVVGPRRSALFSAEQMAGEIDTSDVVVDVCNRLLDAGVQPRFLMFIRDPLDHAESAWQQTVKRKGSTIPVQEGFLTTRPPVRALGILHKIRSIDGAEIEVRNYSRYDDLLAPVAEWLDVPSDVFLHPDVSRVNRGLTLSELRLQMHLNEAFGVAASKVADRLCEMVPGKEAERSFPSPEIQQQLLDRLAPAMDAVDALIPESERYGRDIKPPMENLDAFVFDDDQLRAIVAGLESLLPPAEK